MADNIDIDSLQRSVDDLRALIQGTSKGFNDLNKTNKEAEKGLKAMGRAAAGAAPEVAKGLGSLGKTLAQGDNDLKEFNKVIDVASDAMGAVAKAIPIFGDAVAGALKAAAEGAKFLVERLDTTSKTFVELSKAGATGARGMTAVFEQANRAGLSLQQYSKLIGENSVALARFRGLTSDGADTFGKLVGDLSMGSDELRKLGFNAEQIGETAAAFVTQQTRLGRAQTMTDAELREGTVRYAKELDLLSKLTGANRSEMQKSMDKALSESRFRAKIESLNAEGRTKEAEQMQLAAEQIKQQYGPEVAQGYRDFVAMGAANTEASVTLMAQTGGKLNGILQGMESGMLDSKGAVQELRVGFEDMLPAIRENARAMGDSGILGKNFAAISDGLANKIQANAETVDRAKKTQEAQITATDGLTKQVIGAQMELQKMTVQINELTKDALPMAATAVNHVTRAMGELLNVVKSGGAPGGGKSAPSGLKGAAAGAASLGAGGAIAGGLMAGPLGAIAGGAIGGLIGGVAGSLGMINFGGGPPGVKPEDYIEFGGGTGSRDHFGKLQPAVQQQFLQMAKDYNNLTGKKLRVNSAFRSPEEQANVDSGTNPRAAPGMSLHQQGRAIDINSDQRQYLESSGLLGTYGFKPLAGDPPHIFARDGFSGTVSGPTSGYTPSVVMHGTEELSIRPTTGAGAGNTNDVGAGLMSAQLGKLEELVSAMKRQNDISAKILAYQS